jgi:hypothetical protein
VITKALSLPPFELTISAQTLLIVIGPISSVSPSKGKLTLSPQTSPFQASKHGEKTHHRFGRGGGLGGFLGSLLSHQQERSIYVYVKYNRYFPPMPMGAQQRRKSALHQLRYKKRRRLSFNNLKGTNKPYILYNSISKHLL